MSNKINEIELYSLSNVALDIYRKEARRDKNLSRDILERKFTAMIINSKEMSVLAQNKHIYKFGSFVLIVNERTKKIEVIAWNQDNHTQRKCLTRDQILSFKKTLTEFGLNEDGNAFLDDKKIGA